MQEKVYCVQHGEIPVGEESISNGEPACPHDHETIFLLVTHADYVIAWGGEEESA